MIDLLENGIIYLMFGGLFFVVICGLWILWYWIID